MHVAIARPGEHFVRSRVPLADGDSGTAQTIRAIQRLVDEGLADPYVRRTAIEIVRHVPSYNDVAEAKAIYEWVKRNIRFVKDPDGKELLATPRTILELRAGDCDEINAILLPALLGVIGIRTRLVTIAAHPAAPDQFTHVYAEALIGNRWVPLDAARKDAVWGKAPARFFRKRIWSLTGSAYQDVAGLGQYRIGCPYRSGMGAFNWEGFEKVVSSIGTATSRIISSLKSGGQLVFPSNGSVTLPPPQPEKSQLPAWVLPAAVVGIALLLAKRT